MIFYFCSSSFPYLMVGQGVVFEVVSRRIDDHVGREDIR